MGDSKKAFPLVPKLTPLPSAKSVAKRGRSKRRWKRKSRRRKRKRK